MSEDVVFPHTRESDNEKLGYLKMTEEGFVPIDLLWNELEAAMELTAAEARLEEPGLGYLAEDWWLDVDNQAERVKVSIREVSMERVVVANADFDYPEDIGFEFVLANPTPRLHPASS
ncbi:MULTISPECIES: hypothetical protein [Micrococcaceae]|uniref:Uncharacterized protein n=1 Tax=Arthrobacter rhombi TaxID=71253 RepID=A0A1R4FWI5_9MICC|nr:MULTISPECIES: hypothetical protein [Micrococcaceae]PCC25403.1 hypothetical protein CIK75_06830 [Glutamicibacter sp. BW78]SJM60191.1 hypothetical protein FM101_06205 [Arthrobacter rhombi]